MIGSGGMHTKVAKKDKSNNETTSDSDDGRQ